MVTYLNIRQLSSLPIIAVLMGCNFDIPPKSNVFLQDGIVYFKGAITQESVTKTIELLDESDNSLRFTSEGGANIPAIELANYIYENNTRVVFQIQCYSACANYILPAAKNGVVKKGTVVGWHGGAFQGVWEDDIDQYPEALARIELWKKKETELYTRLNIDPSINIYGVFEDFKLLKSQSYCRRVFDKGNYQGWTYRISDLRKMGIMAKFEDSKIPLGRGGTDIQCYIYPFGEDV